jgi:hypothetical protein
MTAMLERVLLMVCASLFFVSAAAPVALILMAAWVRP